MYFFDWIVKLFKGYILFIIFWVYELLFIFYLDDNDCLKKFFAFLQVKNKMQALQGDDNLFWAFETSAAIKVLELERISK